MMRASKAVVMCVVASVVWVVGAADFAGAVTTQPAGGAAAIRAAFDLINRTPSYFSEMDALKDLVTKEDLPLLHSELLKGQRRSRRAAAWILAHISSSESVEPLRQALAEDKDCVIRWEAAHTLGHIGAKEAEADLIRAMWSDPDPSVRARAAEGLNMLGTTRALAEIRQAAKNEREASVQKALQFVMADVRYRRHQRAVLRAGQVSEGYYMGTHYLVYAPQPMPQGRDIRWLISVHGTWGDPKPYIDIVKSEADRHQLMVLAPHFDYGQYSWFGMFNLRRGKIRPDLRILEIIKDLSRTTVSGKQLLLFGHSEGGQFVHRFVLAHPDLVDRAVAAGSGMLVQPDSEKPFPTGTGANLLAPDLGTLDFGRLVRTPLAMVMGIKDEELRQQRADTFMQAVEQYASQKGITSRVEFIPVPEGGHSGASNWTKARGFLFPDETSAGQSP